MRDTASGVCMQPLPICPARRTAAAGVSAALFAVGMAALADLLQVQMGLLWMLGGCLLSVALAWLPRRRALPAVLGLLGAALLYVLLRLTPVMEGARLACSQLFAASEAVNRYRYLSLAPVAEPQLAGRSFGLAAVLAGGLVCGFCTRRSGCALAAALAMAAVQCYFGIVPAWWLNAAWFGLCAFAALALRADVRDAAVLAAVLAAVVLAVTLAFPGVDPALEDASEALRDRLDAWLQGGTVMEQADAGAANQTRLESRLSEQPADAARDEAADVTAYRKVIREQEEISAPHVLALRRMLLWFAVLLALLVGPFVPFYLWDRRRKQAMAQRAVFEAADDAAAVQAMLRHIDRCLRLAAPVEENTPMHQLPDAMAGRLPQELLAQLQAAVPVWYKAVYSDHPIEQQERSQTAQLLHDTEQYLLQTPDLRLRLRLQWLALLPNEVDA